MPMPKPLQRFYSLFPLRIYDEPFSLPTTTSTSPFASGTGPAHPTLFIHPPSDPTKSLLSTDVECVKWQAYLALRGVSKSINIRWDLSPEGAIDQRLPNLYLPVKQMQNVKAEMKGELLESSRIPSWVDGELGQNRAPRGEDEDDHILEGYVDEDARDESRAWVMLLETDIDAALRATSTNRDSFLKRLITFPSPMVPERPLLTKPYTGLSSMITPFGSAVIITPILERYAEALKALSLRLGGSRWFLGSRGPTALDSVAFAYLHSALESLYPEIREEARKWVNLVAWEQRVRESISASLHH